MDTTELFTAEDARVAMLNDDVRALLTLANRDDVRDVHAAIRLRERALADSNLTPAQCTAAYMNITRRAYAQLEKLGAAGPVKRETVRVKNPALQG